MALAAALALAAATGAADAAGMKPCSQQAGHTIRGRGAVRVYTTPSAAYGCLRGSSRRVALWSRIPEESGALARVRGTFVAARQETDDQYSDDRYLIVTDLVSRARYTIAWLSTPTSAPGTVRGSPSSPGSWPMRAFALAANGRTARLYNTYDPGSTRASGEVLDVIGFHHFRRRLATAASGTIDPGSLAYSGRTVSWLQDGVHHSVRV